MSRFVSAGTTEDDDAWKSAQQSVEEKKKLLEEPHPNEGKSLYEILQANKDAKQDAYEESIRLKNQFRSLDEDETDFLDTVLESSRAQEAAARKETAEQLDQFRKQREEAQRQAQAAEEDTSPIQEETVWHSGPKKRRRGKDKDVIKGIKIRRVSSDARTDANRPTSTEGSKTEMNDQNPENAPPTSPSVSKGDTFKEAPATGSVDGSKNAEASPPPAVSAGLGLGVYSSDED